MTWGQLAMFDVTDPGVSASELAERERCALRDAAIARGQVMMRKRMVADGVVQRVLFLGDT